MRPCGSQVFTLTAVEFVEGFLRQCVEAAGVCVGFELLVPKLGVALGDPFAQDAKVFGREAGNRLLDLGDGGHW